MPAVLHGLRRPKRDGPCNSSIRNARGQCLTQATERCRSPKPYTSIDDYMSATSMQLKTRSILLIALLLGCCSASSSQTCLNNEPAPPTVASYKSVLASNRAQTIELAGLPGFTRSAYYRDHALITPESRVWGPQPGWSKTLTSHLMSPASGTTFSMYLAKMTEGAEAPEAPASDVERFVLVLEGQAAVKLEEGGTIQLADNHYVYFPPGSKARLSSEQGCGLVVYERQYKLKGSPVLIHGNVDESPLIPAPGEVFELRKLLPQTSEYDFNMHIMDFKPGEYLNVKEIHYNQHGLLLLEGQGIYRLADKWYSVQAGDAIWMAPYVVQWYAALGTTRSRYIIFKDTTVDPLLY